MPARAMLVSTVIAPGSRKPKSTSVTPTVGCTIVTVANAGWSDPFAGRSCRFTDCAAGCGAALCGAASRVSVVLPFDSLMGFVPLPGLLGLRGLLLVMGGASVLKRASHAKVISGPGARHFHRFVEVQTRKLTQTEGASRTIRPVENPVLRAECPEPSAVEKYSKGSCHFLRFRRSAATQKLRCDNKDL